MSTDHSASRRAGDEFIVDQAQSQVQTFFDELKNGTPNYRTVASLDEQVAQEYRGRCILELLQNAHDALANAEPGDPRRISFVLHTDPEPVLLIGNSGRPFRIDDFRGICQLAQSPKNPNESVGNKGLGFRSVLEVCTCPEIWSTAPAGSDTSFIFRFDTEVAHSVAEAARQLEEQELDARSPFDADRPVVDWSRDQLTRYLERVTKGEIDGPGEARKFLSPYQIPLPIAGMPPEVDALLAAGHTTVVRLSLDGGRTGSRDEAVDSVKDQLQGLDAQSTIFLQHLESLVIDTGGKPRTLQRLVDLDAGLSDHPRTRRQRLRVEGSGPAADDTVTRQFHLWTRIYGGDEEPDQRARIRDVVQHLPNRWPEVHRISVGVAVEEAPAAMQGVFVIFLPTEMKTGTGAHINAPFYGSLARRQINFDEPYNELLLECVLDLCLDAVDGLVSREPEGWSAGAVVDLLSSTTTVDGGDWRLVEDLQDRASKRGTPLGDHALVLCDGGWCVPALARMMPDVPDDDPIGAERWRDHAGFKVVSSVLVGRGTAVETLLTDLDGSRNVQPQEWRDTIERLATQIQAHNIDITWDAFLNSLVAVLPANLRTEPRAGAAGAPDPLADARFLPAQDGGLVSAAPDSAKLFFQPVRGIDDAAEFVHDVPRVLQDRIAFLHPDVRTHEQEGSRRRTPVQKFLHNRFVQDFRREDILRDVVIPALPEHLPASHGTPEAERCSEILAWTLKLVGDDESDTLLPWVKRLPVACDGGWFAMDAAVFGPGWPDRLGDLVRSLAEELPAGVAARLRRTALLPPDAPPWGVDVVDRAELFARAGVVDGLRLQHAPDVRFHMQGSGFHALPSDPPTGTPQGAWDAWCRDVRAEAKPYYEGFFEYELSEVRLLPEIHHLGRLSSAGRDALSSLVLASLGHWPTNWESVSIDKPEGYSWSTRITSPLKYWLKTLAWLSDRANVEEPLGRRWMVPESYLRGQRDRYSHLHALSLDLARRLSEDSELKDELVGLGLNVYPTEEDRTGPALLDALAAAWTARRVSPGRFDVFLGQVRDAWKHLDPDKGLPDAYLVRTGRRTFATLQGNELADAYLPDDEDRTRSLQAYGKAMLEMRPPVARRKADALSMATNIKRASLLKERFRIDGTPWTGPTEETPALEETGYAAWLPVTLLSVHAYGGTDPSGAATTAWSNAADRLKRARLLECEEIAVELVDGDQVVASSEPEAQWLPDDVLAVRRERRVTYWCLASAAQAMLHREDLLKDLRLVLDALDGRETPTLDQVEAALERAEIDSEALADVRNRLTGANSLVADRIRPVLALLQIPSEELDAAATDTDCLTEWLSSNLRQWPATDLLSAARRSRDDRAMGEAAWRTLGDVAQLPLWNEALTELGDRYVIVENRDADEQAVAHLEAAAPLLRGFARYVAVEAGNPHLFREIEAARQSFKGENDWSTRWWEVPFETVIDALCSRYRSIPDTDHHLDVLENAGTVDDLRIALQRRDVGVDPDPYEIARLNKSKLDEALLRVRDLRRAWLELQASGPMVPEPPDQPADLDPVAYLRRWSDTELLELALRIIDDAEFITACAGCVSVDDIRARLGLNPEDIDEQRRARLRLERETARQRRTFEVAGAPFEVGGTTSYKELFERLDSLTVPDGPRASKDRFTPLAEPRPSSGGRGGGGGGGGGGGKAGKTSHLHPSADLRELVGIVGEIHAYRFLRAEFGTDVTPDAWVSEIRRKVMPLGLRLAGPSKKSACWG